MTEKRQGKTHESKTVRSDLRQGKVTMVRLNTSPTKMHSPAMAVEMHRCFQYRKYDHRNVLACRLSVDSISVWRFQHLHSRTVTDSSARQISTSRLRLELKDGLWAFSLISNNEAILMLALVFGR